MDRKISIFEDVTKDIINKFFKKEYLKKPYFSFYFDEEYSNIDNEKSIVKYKEFDDIKNNIFNKILIMMIKQYDFSMDILKKYILIVKNIENYDIDILTLVFKSIELQHDIIKLKIINSKIDTKEAFENFILENIYFKIDDYNNLLSKYYYKKEYKTILINIFIMIYNYSIFYSIEKIKKSIYIKN